MRSVLFLLGFLLFHCSVVSQSLEFVQGELLIQLKDDRSITEMDRSFAGEPLIFTEVTQIPVSIWKVQFDFNKINSIELLSSLKKDNRIAFAQVNHLIEERVIPNDPQFDMQWQYLQLTGNGGTNRDLDADLAWDISTGGVTPLGDTIVVCVIDDGLDLDHEDFGDNIWVNHREIPNNGIDDDGNGYIDDVNGWDTYNNNSEVGQDGSHGTPVAGIIGAQGNNGIGVTGVNWDVELMIVRGGGNEANALASYAYPYYFRKLYNETDGAAGAFVVSTNASWGTNFGNPADAPIWCNFYDSLGVQGIISCGATANLNIDIDIEGDLPTGCSSDYLICLLYTSPSPRDQRGSRMPSSA